MNINDIEKPEDVPQDFDTVIRAIFEKQKEIALKYAEIEGMGDLLQTTETNLDTAKGQKWIKDFAWRVTEELAEAFESIEHRDHFVEELIDGLHFLTELSIIANFPLEKIDEENLNIHGYRFRDDAWTIVYNLGLMCNCLKNKPWKQSQMLTDRIKFENLLRHVWFEYLGLLKSFNLSYGDIFIYYFKKNEVNKFRIRSKY